MFDFKSFIASPGGVLVAIALIIVLWIISKAEDKGYLVPAGLALGAILFML